ncbi:uncharacterized protein E0L32_000696 [Thyridium curvatum]|uniref:Uncharacterized protein n=1 Tax=Thyridium curvatum TaxID=1093900 RepID=A0A507B589_9PEZI|nr:uncharacterized protein E0L32_000696 [Thyridium curvatum]TPX12519.1 hypothetical protein E0L32_000696 [Thyridium curvatum]
MNSLAFGDSYTFVQGTHGHQNFSFIGDYLPKNFAYTPQDLLSNRIVQNFTGTAEGGPNWVEFLTGCGVHKGLHSPLLCKKQLWDFAFAGADVSESFTPLHHDFTIPLVNQTQQFLAYGQDVFKKKLCVDPDRTLVAIWIGINDINDSAKYNVSFPHFYDSIISAIFSESADPLYGAGYRHFLFVNLPPLDRTPSNQRKVSPLPSKEMIQWWNGVLERRSEMFEQTHEGSTSMLFDANTFLNYVMDNAGKYRITNTTDFCAGYGQADVLQEWEKYGCPVPLSQYFWFNSGHM